jgi:hypothetical protein
VRSMRLSLRCGMRRRSFRRARGLGAYILERPLGKVELIYLIKSLRNEKSNTLIGDPLIFVCKYFLITGFIKIL